MNAADDARDDVRPGVIQALAMVFTPWRAGRIAARLPVRVRYFILVGILWFPALGAGESLGRALHHRVELPAPRAELLGRLAFGVGSSVPAWQIALGVAVWLAGSLACGAVLIEFGGALLGALLRDRPLDARIGAAASLFAPILVLAVGVAQTAVLRVHHRRDWLAVALVGALVLWPVIGWGSLARAAARHAARPRLPPAGCAVGFAAGCAIAVVVAVQALANATVALLPSLVRWVVP